MHLVCGPLLKDESFKSTIVIVLSCPKSSALFGRATVVTAYVLNAAQKNTEVQ